MLLHALVCLLYVSKSMHTTQSTSLCTVFLHVLWFEFAIRFVCIKEKGTFLWFFIFAIGCVIWNECAKSKLKTALHPLNDGYSPHTPERIIWLVSLVSLGGSLLSGLLSFYCRQCRCLKHSLIFTLSVSCSTRSRSSVDQGTGEKNLAITTDKWLTVALL